MTPPLADEELFLFTFGCMRCITALRPRLATCHPQFAEGLTVSFLLWEPFWVYALTDTRAASEKQRHCNLT